MNLLYAYFLISLFYFLFPDFFPTFQPSQLLLFLSSALPTFLLSHPLTFSLFDCSHMGNALLKQYNNSILDFGTLLYYH